MIFTIVAFLESLPTISGAPSAAKIVGLFLLIGWLVTVAFRPLGDSPSRDLAARFPALVWILGLFLSWVLFSLLWAEDVAVARETFFRYALNFVLFPIVFTAIWKPQHLLSLYSVFIAGGILGGIIGLQTAARAGVQEQRLGGAGLNPNELGALLAVGVVLAVCLAFSRSNGAARTVALGAGLISALLLIMTESRGALLGLVAAIFVTPFVAGKGRRIGAIVVAGAAVLSVAVWLGTTAPEQTRERLTHDTSSGSGRVDLWTVGLRMVEDKPITGVGAGNFPVSSIHYLLRPGTIARDEFIVDHPKVTHNIYLQVLSELGVIGLGLFIALILTCLTCALRAARAFRQSRDPTMELLARGLFVALVALLVADFFSSALYSKQLYLLLATGPALLTMAHTRRSTSA